MHYFAFLEWGGGGGGGWINRSIGWEMRIAISFSNMFLEFLSYQELQKSVKVALIYVATPLMLSDNFRSYHNREYECKMMHQYFNKFNRSYKSSAKQFFFEALNS